MKTSRNFFFMQRILAYCIDYFLILLIITIGFIPVTFLTAFGDLNFDNILMLYYIIFFPITSILYFTISEVKVNTTIGKKFYNIGIINEESKEYILLIQSVIRNLLKFFPPLVIIDFIIGYFIRPSSNQRIFEILSKTKVAEMEGFVYSRYTNQEQAVIKVFRIVLTLLGVFFILLLFLSLINSIISS